MDTQQRRHLQAIADHLRETRRQHDAVENIAGLTAVPRPERRTLLAGLEEAGLIELHQGPSRVAGPTYDVELTSHGLAMLAAPEPATSSQGITDRWHDRDLPILTALAQAEDNRSELTVDEITAATGLRYADIHASVERLTRTGYVDRAEFSHDLGGAYAYIRLSAQGLEAVGVWPTPENAADRLLAALEHLAEHAPDEPTRSKGKAALAQLGGLGRDTLAAVAATVITGQLPSQ